MQPAPGEVDDLAFDSRLPRDLREQSLSHFTPIHVAQHAATLLAPQGRERVLDVGAGAGKFCLVGAHMHRAAQFVGVEIRPHLVEIANRLAAEWRLANATFIHGDALAIDWSEFDSFYFFNPFAEQRSPPIMLLDETLEIDSANFSRYVDGTLDRLARARPDTRVVTYHGLGAEMPSGYELVRLDRIGSDRVELWIRTGYWQSGSAAST